MKKLLVLFGIAMLLSGTEVFASKFEAAPNMGNLDFYPMMQRQMEQEETLDFVNKSENYKKNREKKNNDNKVRESHFDPNYSPNYGGAFLHPVHPVQMQFTKGADGSIKIQGIKSNSTTLIDADK